MFFKSLNGKSQYKEFLEDHKMRKTKKVVVSLVVLVGLSGFLAIAMAGSLEPSSAPAPTMRTLDEIYAVATSSSGNSFIISGKEFAADDREIISMHIAEYPGSGFEGIQPLEGKSKILKLDHLITVPFDPTTGQAGVRVHSPIRVVKTIDKATPGLHKACVTGQNLNEVVIDFYRVDSPMQQNAVYYKVTLRQARVIEIGPTTDFVTPDSYRHMEMVSLVYEEIEWNWLPDGVVEMDQWQAPGGA